MAHWEGEAQEAWAALAAASREQGNQGLWLEAGQGWRQRQTRADQGGAGVRWEREMHDVAEEQRVLWGQAAWVLQRARRLMEGAASPG